MGLTMQQLGDTMTAQEFGQHYALECTEPLPPAHRQALARLLATQANGPLQPPAQGRLWAAHDFAPDLWEALAAEQVRPAEPEPITVDQILARARLAGMVH